MAIKHSLPLIICPSLLASLLFFSYGTTAGSRRWIWTGQSGTKGTSFKHGTVLGWPGFTYGRSIGSLDFKDTLEPKEYLPIFGLSTVKILAKVLPKFLHAHEHKHVCSCVGLC